MSPFFISVGKQRHFPRRMSLKGDIYITDKYSIIACWADVLGFGDRYALRLSRFTAAIAANAGNRLKKNAIYFLARSLLISLRGSFSCL